MTGETQRTAPYRIEIEPVAGQVRVTIDDVPVAESSGAMVLHETYKGPQFYIPKKDVIDGLLQPSPYKTFCPFKGTAHHWHLRASSRTVENGAWSYERPLQEALSIGGYVSFSPDPTVRVAADPQLVGNEIELVGGNALIDWLLQKAWLCTSPAALTEQFAAQLLSIGIPLWRLGINLWTLHPQLAGKRYTWSRDQDGVGESDTPHGELQSPAYLNSPVRHVSEHLGGVRQRLDVDDPEFPFPIFKELRAGGGTDYVAMPLPFSDGQFQTMTLASDRPGGFSTADLGQVFEASAVLARFYEVMTLRRNASDLLDTYLGVRTGRQVLGGLTQRGDGQNIRAAIIFCDLRDSTTLGEAMSREAYLELLNEFFERAAGPVLAGGGEVLKFIGDAVLAIFPLEDEAAGDSAISNACRSAREAADEIVDRIAAFPSHPDRPAPRCAIGLHFGNVMYGNVGAPERLDFTVIGTAANVAARLSEHCKALNQALLVSADVARYAPDGLQSLGSQELRNLSGDLEVFGLAGAAIG